MVPRHWRRSGGGQKPHSANPPTAPEGRPGGPRGITCGGNVVPLSYRLSAAPEQVVGPGGVSLCSGLAGAVNLGGFPSLSNHILVVKYAENIAVKWANRPRMLPSAAALAAEVARAAATQQLLARGQRRSRGPRRRNVNVAPL